MPVQFHDAKFRQLSADELSKWSGAETAAVSDCLERSMAMDGGISPIADEMRIVGQARTVRCMVGDNSALHAAITLARPGEVLIADAGGFLGTAVWGGLMTHAAKRQGVAGLIIDGAVRDRSEIVELDFPCYARGLVPAGPHKAFGGAIDCPVNCGGVAVRPGDLVIADSDGVTIIPLERVEETWEAYQQLKEKEAKALSALESGGTLGEIYGVPEIIRV